MVYVDDHITTVKEDTVDKKNFLSIKEVAELLGLKYHHTRKLLYADTELQCYGYGRTKRWALADIIAFQERHLLVA